MRVSAVRFGADLWQLLEDEAALVGVSAAQYVREASPRACVEVSACVDVAFRAATAAARGEERLEAMSAQDAIPCAARTPNRRPAGGTRTTTDPRDGLYG